MSDKASDVATAVTSPITSLFSPPKIDTPEVADTVQEEQADKAKRLERRLRSARAGALSSTTTTTPVFRAALDTGAVSIMRRLLSA